MRVETLDFKRGRRLSGVIAYDTAMRMTGRAGYPFRIDGSELSAWILRDRHTCPFGHSGQLIWRTMSIELVLSLLLLIVLTKTKFKARNGVLF